MNGITIGTRVKWTSARTSLGVVVHLFSHNGQRYAVIESDKDKKALQVVRIYDKLIAH